MAKTGRRPGRDARIRPPVSSGPFKPRLTSKTRENRPLFHQADPRSQAAGAAAGGGAKAFDQGFGSLDPGKSGLDVDQAEIIAFAIVLAKRPFGVLELLK